ncbi:hypothetical protein H5410_056494 [Solanum commersonii]|uniref:Uncharacterized protein n=1 Tax=Solanum commersonii TaxID=4109 RepID=A0A9J5WMU4_SOLCO|nr:hypothetical protein H5410_056494 [Solanum commersonii]
MTSKIWITKRSIDYSTQKLAKPGVYPLRWSFDFENGSVYPLGPTISIAKFLTDIHKKVEQKRRQKYRSPKDPWTMHMKISKMGDPWTIAHDNEQNGVFTRSGAHLTLKMGQRPQNFLAKLTSEIWITKRSMDYSTQKLAKQWVYLLRGSFDLENGVLCPSRPTGYIAKMLRGSFILENWPVCPSGPTSSIAKV